MNIMLSVILGASIIIAILYIKMVLIWRDVMLKQNERRKRDIERTNN